MGNHHDSTNTTTTHHEHNNNNHALLSFASSSSSHQHDDYHPCSGTKKRGRPALLSGSSRARRVEEGALQHSQPDREQRVASLRQCLQEVLRSLGDLRTDVQHLAEMDPTDGELRFQCNHYGKGRPCLVSGLEHMSNNCILFAQPPLHLHHHLDTISTKPLRRLAQHSTADGKPFLHNHYVLKYHCPSSTCNAKALIGKVVWGKGERYVCELFCPPRLIREPVSAPPRRWPTANASEPPESASRGRLGTSSTNQSGTTCSSITKHNNNKDNSGNNNDDDDAVRSNSGFLGGSNHSDKNVSDSNINHNQHNHANDENHHFSFSPTNSSSSSSGDQAHHQNEEDEEENGSCDHDDKKNEMNHHSSSSGGSNNNNNDHDGNLITMEPTKKKSKKAPVQDEQACVNSRNPNKKSRTDKRKKETATLHPCRPHLPHYQAEPDGTQHTALLTTTTTTNNPSDNIQHHYDNNNNNHTNNNNEKAVDWISVAGADESASAYASAAFPNSHHYYYGTHAHHHHNNNNEVPAALVQMLLSGGGTTNTAMIPTITQQRRDDHDRKCKEDTTTTITTTNYKDKNKNGGSSNANGGATNSDDKNENHHYHNQHHNNNNHEDNDNNNEEGRILRTGINNDNNNNIEKEEGEEHETYDHINPNPADEADNYYPMVKQRFERFVFQLDNPVGYAFLGYHYERDNQNAIQLLKRAELMHHFESVFFVDPEQTTLSADNDEQRAERRAFVPVWLKDSRKKKKLEIVYFPGQVPRHVFNSWRGFQADRLPPIACKTEVERLVKPLLEHIYLVIARSKDEDMLFVLRWLAQIVRHPNEKTQVAIFLYGVEGCGKNLIFDLMQTILGPPNGFQTSAPERDIFGTFVTAFDKALLIQTDEVKRCHDYENLFKVNKKTYPFHSNNNDNVIIKYIIRVVIICHHSLSS